MSQTQKTLAALLTRLADNTSGAITPEDIRDLLVSLTPSRGGMTIEPADAAATTISAQAAWTPLAGTWTANGGITMRDWSMPTNGTLRYDGAEDQVLQVTGKVSIQPGGANTEYSIALAVDGVVNERFAASVAFAGPHSGDTAVTMPLTAPISISPGQLLTLWVRNDSGTEDVTAERATLSVLGFIQ